LPQQWKESIILPIYKKGDKTERSNYRGVSLLPTANHMLYNILSPVLIPYAENTTGNHQCGFRRNKSITDQIFCIGQITEKKWEYNGAVHLLFIGFQKACVSDGREVITEFCVPI
jgi:hypothetical protein